MVGFTEPNRYEPRAGWRLALAQWAQEPPGAEGSWQHQIGIYWRWRTLDGMSLREAWDELGMTPDIAQSALNPGSPDRGLIPPELFSRVLARSRAADINPDDNVDDVIIAPTPPTELPDHPEVGFTPARTNPPRPAIYQPRRNWKTNLLTPSANAVKWLAELHIYWRKRTEQHKSLEEAWTELNIHHTNAATSLNKNLFDRGSIPPELIGRVVARSQSQPLDANLEGIIIYPEIALTDAPPRIDKEPGKHLLGAARVDIAAFAPAEVRRQDVFMVQLYFYRTDLASLVERLATATDLSTSNRTRDKTKLKSGDNVAVTFNAQGAQIVGDLHQFEWDGEWAVVRTLMHVVPSFEPAHLFIKALYWIEGAARGSVLFSISVVQCASKERGEIQRKSLKHRHYDNAFISYASEDEEDVLPRVEGIAATGVEPFLDRTNLRAGEPFKERILTAIDKCDVFYLFWSQHAAASEWVKLETDYALKRKRGDENNDPDIIGITLPGPSVDPPAELKDKIHFSSVYRLAILASQRQAQLDQQAEGRS